jgi:hypothetical protein
MVQAEPSHLEQFFEILRHFWGSEFSLISFLLGLTPFALYWFNSWVSFKRENIRELKHLAKELIDLWSSMKESALQIMMFASWIKGQEGSDNAFFRDKLPEWYESLYREKRNLQLYYNKSTRLIGCLYFYYDGYHIQNKLDDLFLEMKDTDWESQTYIKSRNALWKCQGQGVEILQEIKKEIDALSKLWPRPIHWVVIRWNLLYLQTYEQRRWAKVMVKRKLSRFHVSHRRRADALMVSSDS